MNRIYNVIWSKTKKCYVVVSEFAKNNSGKKKIVGVHRMNKKQKIREERKMIN